MCNNRGNILICGVTLQDAQDFQNFLKENGLYSPDFRYINTCSETSGCGMQVDKVYMQKEVSSKMLTALLPCTSFSPLHWCERVQFFYRENDTFVVYPKFEEEKTED